MLLYWALRAAFFLSRHVPLSWRYRVGEMGAEAVYWLWPSKRYNTRRNMMVVAGDWRRARALARASWRNYGRYVVDFLNLPTVAPEAIFARTRAEGWEHVERALERGKGAIFVTGHFGLWDYAAGVLAHRYPGRVNIVVEPFASPHVERLIQGQRSLRGSNIIPMTDVRGMVRALRSNNILAVLIDRPTHDDGVPVTFFGRETLVPGGGARLAAMTGAVLLPGYMAPRADGSYDGCIMPPIQSPRSGDRCADARRMLQDAFSAFERVVAREPEWWFMFREMWPRSGHAARRAEAAL